MERLELNEDGFVALLDKLIGESEFVQNNPPKFVPKEDKIIEHLLTELAPYDKKNGGVLDIKHVFYKPGRGNLLIDYVPESAKSPVAFMGSHLDVVPADPSLWTKNPFKLTREGDKLYGRGTTDCLGHVALVTQLFCQLGAKKPALNVSVHAVFIASEENNSVENHGVGVDRLMQDGLLNHLKDGPIFWIDSADSQPCIGTAGVNDWTLKVSGRLFHSGLPHKAINSLELGSEALALIQRRFYEDFPPHPSEKIYSFATPSTMKPTQIKCAEGALNQIPPWVEIRGDVRLTPFYKMEDVMSKVSSYVDDINADLSALPTRGTASKYSIVHEDQEIRGKVEIIWGDEPFKGLACKLDSPGFFAFTEATKRIKGDVKPYAICGSLPLVGDLQAAGFDVQVGGFGHSSVYHGNDEYCSVSDMKDAMKILSEILVILHDKSA